MRRLTTTLLTLLVLPRLAVAQGELPVEIRTDAINVVAGGRATALQITIDRWSTQEEVALLYDAIRGEPYKWNQAEVDKALESLEPVGRPTSPAARHCLCASLATSP